MRNLIKHEGDFIPFAYYIRIFDDLPGRPNHYTFKFLSYISDPFFESVILSNKWDKVKKTMIVDPNCSFKLVVGGSNKLVFNFFDVPDKPITRPFVSARQNYQEELKNRPAI